ncbi:hypothetical protein POTOM_005387 [Populus tomentosa]|uniref:Chromatin target of PRMT1 protein C-terminal domain-containing protein n=1 Tax=Populus tomentosa TaxID=118781 RepID=A0A8X8AWL5_POPTO|nr:hypothetical protein POTOM_005387 [Populus tomentosa]
MFWIRDGGVIVREEMYLLDGSVNSDKGIMSFIVVVNDGVRRVDGHDGRGRGGALGRLRGGGIGGVGGGGGRGFGRGRGRGRGRGEKVSAEDLDADLEKYHSEAMQIN